MEAPSPVTLRQYAADDASALYEAVREVVTICDPWMPWCRPDFSMEDARAWVTKKVAAFDQRTGFEFAVVSRSGLYVGSCGLSRIDQSNKRANLGYWVRPFARNAGVATSAVRLTRDWAFSQTDLICLELIVPVGNVASCKVAEKSGAQYEGTLRTRLIIDGTAHDTAIFSFLR